MPDRKSGASIEEDGRNAAAGPARTKRAPRSSAPISAGPAGSRREPAEAHDADAMLGTPPRGAAPAPSKEEVAKSPNGRPLEPSGIVADRPEPPADAAPGGGTDRPGETDAPGGTPAPSGTPALGGTHAPGGTPAPPEARPGGGEAARRYRRAPAKLYSVHPAIAQMQAIRDNLARSTGKSLAAWIKLLNAGGPAGAKARTDWLKTEHKLTSATAKVIADAAEGRESEETDPKAYLRKAPEYVDAMYAGPKAGLRSIHDALVVLARSFGEDVRICPGKTMVPLYREHVFAEIRPAARDRLDLGLALRGVRLRPAKRLIDFSDSRKKDRITHRVSLRTIDEIDEELRGWLRTAYELDSPARSSIR